MGGGGEVVAEVCVGGDENSGEKKNLPWMEIGKRSWELDGNKEGATRRGCFIFFFLWLGEEKNIKILIPSQHKSMFAPSQHHGGGWARQI